MAAFPSERMWSMGKSLSGKELGQGITQRKDGRYQARFTDRFGKRKTIYAKTLNEIRQKLRNEQYEDEKRLNVVSSSMTLDEWFDVWMETCKKNCRNTTRACYTHSYNRIRKSLGWRKLNAINLIVMQQAFNELKTDMSRRDTKRILTDMYYKAMDADLVLKNIPLQVNTIVNKDSRPDEPRVLTIAETELFLEAASHYRYYNAFRLNLETGMRIGEVLGLQWSDIDFENQAIYVNRTLVYVTCNDEMSPMYGKKVNEFHEPKTKRGRRKIPMTLKAYQILKEQELWKAEIIAQGYKAPTGFENLVFVNTRNSPISRTDTDLVMKLISDRIAKEHEDFKPLTPHTLRHTFATRCIERGMNPKTIQIILGHSSINITMDLYCHVTEDTLVYEMSKFENEKKENEEEGEKSREVSAIG